MQKKMFILIGRRESESFLKHLKYFKAMILLQTSSWNMVQKLQDFRQNDDSLFISFFSGVCERR